jgi:hypothetical protein
MEAEIAEHDFNRDFHVSKPADEESQPADHQSSPDTRYNGWANYETWAVKLWIDNEENTCNYWQETAKELWDDTTPQYEWQTKRDALCIALADRLKNEHEENAPTAEQSSDYTDLLNAALGSVNWYEIAEAMKSSATFAQSMKTL